MRAGHPLAADMATDACAVNLTLTLSLPACFSMDACALRAKAVRWIGRLAAGSLVAWVCAGQAVVVDNKVGSKGQVAAEFVARAPANGHTLLVGMDSLFVINPYLYARRGVDVNQDLMPVATLGSNQFVLALHPQLPVKAPARFVARAKKSNPPLAYASAGRRH
ncbi:MAG: hypothetical protein EBY24_06920 [Betaproteobacteria bacterium]|nr:hypothetical protein [Betaproteobacteria bacterium]